MKENRFKSRFISLWKKKYSIDIGLIITGLLTGSIGFLIFHNFPAVVGGIVFVISGLIGVYYKTFF